MRSRLAICTSAVVVILVLVMVAPAAALPDNPISLNARMMHWQENPAVIHIMVFQDDGRWGVPAEVDAGQPLLFGFEWGADEGQTVEDLQAILDDPNTSFTVSVDGQAPIDIAGFYQPAFYTETQSGPAWTWDHDGDGPGDGDGDGIGDWNGPIVFFRYPHPGLDTGEHTFEFEAYWLSTDILFVDTIIVNAGP